MTTPTPRRARHVNAKPKKVAEPRSSQEAKAAGNTATSEISSTLAFYLDDFARTLFPLKTNRELITRGEPEIRAYIEKCRDEKETAISFTAQRRVYAAKPGLYLRRTIKLDPVAEYYFYDLVFRNRSLFRKPHAAGRAHYGYRFANGIPIAPTAAYRGFKSAIADYGDQFVNNIGFDVASYFNSIYQHDIVSWFSELGADSKDVDGLGQLLREINSGRSVDCLPQGLYPTKMIGNDFLRFIDNYHGLKSNQLVRFMDDIYIFSNDERVIADDFQLIQRLLGDKGLSVNPQKTTKNKAARAGIDGEIDAIKRRLLAKRRDTVVRGYEQEDIVVSTPLDDDELEYIDNVLARPDIDEDDAELILTIMTNYASKVEQRLPYILSRYPHLTKSVFRFCATVTDRETIAEMILELATADRPIEEFQLFWYGVILEEYLMNTSRTAAIISALFGNRSATLITKAKILENPDTRFGLPELRNEYLDGQSGWLAWSSAVGSRSLKPASRNYRLKYFAKWSPINNLIATIMLKA